MTTKTPAALTADDLDRALRDERHLGFGYSERRRLPLQRREELDRAVLARANSFGWDYEALFAWVNGKNGRYACDEATEEDRKATQIAARYLRDGWDR